MSLAPDLQPRPTPALEAYLEERSGEFDRIPPDRAVLLTELAGHVHRAIADAGSVRLVFICTHNSRRSHITQLFAAAAAAQAGLTGLETFSGGTEVTAFNPRAVAALERAGFVIERTGDGENPIHLARFALGRDPLRCFSKTIEDPANPTTGFAAVLTCSEADAACPVVPGADARFPIRYEDPKLSDGTPEETAAYDERCRQIAREMVYAFSQIRPV